MKHFTSLLGLLVLSGAAPVHAQVAASFEQLRERLAPGDIIYVTDSTGRTTKETVRGLSTSTLELAGGQRVLTEQEVRQIRVERDDPPWRGFLIGLAAVGGPWLALCAPSDWCYYNEYGGEDLYRRIAVMTTAVAAGLGALIDLSIKEKVPVYVAPGRAAMRLQVAPIVSPSGAGVQVSARF
jgi:hypothetical protein